MGTCRFHKASARQEAGPSWDSQEQELTVHANFLKLALEVQAHCSSQA